MQVDFIFLKEIELFDRLQWLISEFAESSIWARLVKFKMTVVKNTGYLKLYLYFF